MLVMKMTTREGKELGRSEKMVIVLTVAINVVWVPGYMKYLGQDT